MQDMYAVLSDVLSERPTRKKVEPLVTQCHHISRSYLYLKKRRGHLPGYLLRYGFDDLALDSIADLFERDESGRFSILRRYFEGRNWRSCSHERLMSLTRRLVFSHVNNYLFEVHRQHDPTLSKIIRGLKRAARGHEEVALSRRGGRLWIKLEEHPAEDAPSMPPEVMEQYLAEVLSEATDLQMALSGIVVQLGRQQLYERAYSVSQLAMLIRTLIGHQLRGEGVGRTFTPPKKEPLIPEPYVQGSIEVAVDATHDRLYDTYVDDQMDESTYDSVIAAARRILLCQYTTTTTGPISHMEAYRSHVRDVSYESYRSEHRGVLEYVVRVARSELVQRLRSAL